jgi:hypothetical protein
MRRIGYLSLMPAESEAARWPATRAAGIPNSHSVREEILMSASTSSTSVYTTGVFWERLWRMSGINFVFFFIIAYVIYGYQPQVGASADALVAFYHGDRTRILIAAVFSGMAALNLLWFAAALRTTLADAGQDGWARRRPPPAQRSEGCFSCSSRWVQPSRTRSPAPEITRSHRD